MCGRYMVLSSPEAIRRLFGYPEQPNFPPRYNVAPTQPVPIVRMVDGRREFALVRWGLIPPWVKDPRRFSLLINARVESVHDKPAFRYAMRRRRCLFPADGFYEWQSAGGRRRPFCVRPREAGPIAFAGLWETWMGPNGEEMETAAIVTTAASPEIAHLHDRMPVILPADAFDMWLDCGNVDALTAAVNHADNDGPALIEPAPPPQPGAERDEAAPAKSARKKDDRQFSLF
jgi:putative SOS response-associated peptidase YedK